MKRGLRIGVGILVIVVAIGGYFVFALAEEKPPILVGLLHSQTGPLAASEKPLIDAEILALEEINASGGILGRRVQWVIADGRSNSATFAQQAQRLITIDKVSVIFGCSASHCRKSVKPVVEENNHLLFYPASYEGLEESPNIVYTGGPANQQVMPGVAWSMDVLKARKLYLIGTDSLRGRALNAQASDAAKALGGEVVGDDYLPLDSKDVARAVEAIKKAAPDVVISSLEGESNAPFYEELSRAKLTPAQTPVVSFSLTELDLKTIPLRDLIGQFGAENYFQSVERPENEAFVRRFKARSGPESVTNVDISTAYNSVKLWAQAVADAQTDATALVRQAVRRQSYDAPEGVVTVDNENLNEWRPFFVGKVRPDGQFEILYTLPKPIHPVPYPWTRTRTEWEAFLRGLTDSWGGQWENPARAAAPR